MTHYDLIVIGGGPAGSLVAEGAVEAGLTVALVEEDQLGGTCLNYGCDPTNAFIRAGDILRLARNAGQVGVEVGTARLDWPVLRSRISDMIDDIRGGDGHESVREKGIDLYNVRATFVSEGEIRAGNHLLTADQFLIATGNMVQPPEVEGLQETGYITHADVFSLDEMPGSLIIVGGGPHAVELGQSFLNFGIDVVMVTPESRLLPREDADISAALTNILEREGMTIFLESEVLSASRSGEGTALLSIQTPEDEVVTIEVDEILLASERVPRVSGLGLERAGVDFSAQGIQVNAGMRTSVPHIWAAGDVTGIYPYTSIANYQGRIALHNILYPESPRRADYRVVPWKVFSQPELARVGLTEVEARAGDFDVVTSTMRFADMPRSISLEERDGFAKLIVDRRTREILGGHILGAHASEVLAEVALAMRHRLPVSALSDTIHIHPTMAEAVFWAADNLVTGELSHKDA